MQIAILGAGRVGSALGRLWHAAGHDVTFAARDAARPRALAAELGERAHAASVAGAVARADAVLVAVPGPAVTDVLRAAGPLDGRVVIDAANSFGPRQVTLRSLAGAFPRARWVRAFNSLSVSIMADDNHRTPPWVMFLSGDEDAKPVVTQLIQDAGFDPVDLGGIDDSPLQDPGGAYGSIRGYFASFPDAGAAAADLRRRFKFLGDTGVWRLLTSASRDIG